MVAKRKRKQKQSLKEFKAWLQGVEELQPDGWAPNAEQWKLIRNKIDGIVEEKPAAPQPQRSLTQPTQPMPSHNQAQANPVVQTALPQPPPVGGLPPVEVEMTPAARKLLNPGADGKTQTPDMDTSDGNVTSPFV